MGHLRSLLGTNFFLSLSYAISGILCVTSFQGRELTDYLTYIGILGVAGVGIQSLQTKSFLNLTANQKSENWKANSRIYFFISQVVFISILLWFFRENSKLFPVVMSIIGIIVISQHLHYLMGLHLKETRIRDYTTLNLFIGFFVLIVSILQHLLELQFWIYLISITFIYIAIIAVMRKPLFEYGFTPVIDFRMERGRLSVTLVWMLVSSDLIFSSRILSSQESRTFYMMTLVTKVLLIYFTAIFYTSTFNSLPQLRNQIFLVNFLILLSLCLVHALGNWLTTIKVSIPLEQLLIAQVYGNAIGIFLNSAKSHFQEDSSKNRNSILLILWLFMAGMLMMIYSYDLSARTLCIYLSGYYLVASYYLYFLRRRMV